MRQQLPLERICAQYGFIFLLPQKNNIRIQRSQASKGFAKGKARFPFALFWFLLQEQKKRPGGEPYRLKTFIRLCDADRRDGTKP